MSKTITTLDRITFVHNPLKHTVTNEKQTIINLVPGSKVRVSKDYFATVMHIDNKVIIYKIGNHFFTTLIETFLENNSKTLNNI